MFDFDIEVFVPQIAMSGGTVIACASKKIHMGKQSNLGPIDPQIKGVPAGEVLDEFKRAAQDIKKQPETTPLWQAIVSKYPPAFILGCENAIEWLKEITKKYLEKGMFFEDESTDISEIIKKLSDHNLTRNHSRHISLTEAQEIGLKIDPLENDNELQDTILTIHHAYMHTFNITPTIKIVENHQAIGQIQVQNMPMNMNKI